jgi:phenylacetate-CoA ligase
MSIQEVRSYYQKFARTEWLSGEELRAHQAPLLARLLKHARQTTDFYRERIALDLESPDDIREAWAQLPTLSRSEAVANRERLKSRGIPPEMGQSVTGETSGSTGMPFVYRKNSLCTSVDAALTERMLRWWSVDGKKTFGFIIHDREKNAAPPDGSVSRGWHSARPNGLKYTLSHAADIDTQLKWLIARRPDYLLSYSAILKELAIAAQRRGVEMKLDLIFSAAAILDADTRALCRSVFHAEIVDGYGAQEVGHLAAQCRDCGEYHVSAEGSLVEILREDGSPAESGETGRVVVTPLFNYAMPLIRYELGDFAEVGSSTPSCGRGLPTLRRILGRYRNMLRFRDGTVVWPYDAAFELEKFISLKQFQIVQTGFDHIEIKYVPDSSERSVDLAALTDHVRNALRQRVDISLTPVERIERSAGGKYEDCICLIEAAREQAVPEANYCGPFKT